MDHSLEELLERAASAAWQDRRAAAASLARVDDPRATAAMARLLRDPADTAVVQSAARALPARADAYGADLIFRTLAELDAEDDDQAEDTLSLLLFFLARDWKLLHASGLYAAANEAAHGDPDPAIREGGRILVAYLSGKI